MESAGLPVTEKKTLVDTAAKRALESELTAPGDGGGRVYVKTILALAVATRVGMIVLLLSRKPASWLFSKGIDLGYVAQSLSSGHGLSSPFGGSTGPSAFLPPGYPALLAFLFRVFGSYSNGAALALMASQALFSVLTVAAMLYVARRMFGAATANVAGAVWAVSLPLLAMVTIPWDTCLSSLLLVGMMALALMCVARPRTSLWAAMGIYCGVAMLVNPSLTLVLFAMVGWAVIRTEAWRGAGPVVWLVVVLAVFAPWPIRNARVLHAFIPLRSNFGYELWQGNRDGATGVFDVTLYPTGDREEYAEYAAEGEVAYMRHKSEVAKRFIREHPGEFVKLTAERIVRFWTGAGGDMNYPIFVLHSTVTTLLGFCGLAVLVRRRRPVAMLFLPTLLLFPLPYYVTHPDFRFRALLDPMMTILSAVAVVWMWEYARRDAAGTSKGYPQNS